jgi:hypothetical protein
MKKILLNSIGADVEVFLKNKHSNQVVSAEGYIKGTKENPFIFDKKNNFFSTSLDNVLAEFTIPPANNVEDFVKYLQKGLSYINKSIPKDLCTHIFPAANLDNNFLKTEQALKFGCEPDANAYLKWVNITPSSKDKTLRSAGGHIHLGYNETYLVPDLQNPNEEILNNDLVRQTIIKALDLFVGIPMLIYEPNNKRKELYGKAGAYRPKTYGVEYRTLSNYYLTSEKLTKLVFNNTIEAINFLNKGNIIEKELGFFVENTINNSNIENAKYLIKEFKIAV